MPDFDPQPAHPAVWAAVTAGSQQEMAELVVNGTNISPDKVVAGSPGADTGENVQVEGDVKSTTGLKIDDDVGVHRAASGMLDVNHGTAGSANRLRVGANGIFHESEYGNRFAIGTHGQSDFGLPSYQDAGAIMFQTGGSQSVISGGGSGYSTLKFYPTSSFSAPIVEMTDSGVIVAGLTRSRGMLQLGTDGTQQGYIRIFNNSVVGAESNIYSDASTGGLRMDTGGNARPITIQGSEVHLTPAGNIGLGTDDPEYKAHVTSAGNTFLMVSSPGGLAGVLLRCDPGVNTWNSYTTTDGKYHFGIAGVSDYLHMAYGGNLGLGASASSPQAKLSLGDDVTAQKLLLFDSGTTRYGFGIQGGELRMFCAGAGHISFGSITGADGVTWTEHARIDSVNGNLLVGTASDTGERLQVAGNIKSTQQIQGQTLYTTNEIYANCRYTTYTPDGLFSADATPCIFATNGAGRTLIGYEDNGSGGYAPRIGFHQVYSLVAAPATTSSKTSIGLVPDGSFTLKNGPSNTETLRVTPDGFLLVGTASDTGERLQVAGNIKSTQQIQGQTLYTTNEIYANCRYTTYTPDGLFSADATPCIFATNGAGRTLIGYEDNGSGGYAPRIGFHQVYSLVAAPATTSSKTSIGLVPDGSFTLKNGPSNTETLRVTPDGFLGLDEDDPTQRLHVHGQGVFTGDVCQPDPGDGVGPALRVGFQSAYDQAYVQGIHTGVALKDLMLQPSSGNVGVGLPLGATLAGRLTVDSKADPGELDLAFSHPGNAFGNYRSGISNQMDSSNLGNNSMHFRVCDTSATGSNAVMSLFATGKASVNAGVVEPNATFEVRGTTNSLTSASHGLLILSDASNSNKRVIISYDNSLGTFGAGYISSVHNGYAWTPLILNPNSGGVIVNGSADMGGALQVYGSTKLRVNSDKRLIINDFGGVGLAAYNDAESALTPLKLYGSSLDFTGTSTFNDNVIGKAFKTIEAYKVVTASTTVDLFSVASYGSLISGTLTVISTDITLANRRMSRYAICLVAGGSTGTGVALLVSHDYGTPGAITFTVAYSTSGGTTKVTFQDTTGADCYVTYYFTAEVNNGTLTQL